MMKDKTTGRTGEYRAPFSEFQECPSDRFFHGEKLIEPGNLQDIAAIGQHLGQDELAALRLKILLQSDKESYARTAQVGHPSQVDHYGGFVVDCLKSRFSQIRAMSVQAANEPQQRNGTYLFSGDNEVRHAGTMGAWVPGVNRTG